MSSFVKSTIVVALTAVCVFGQSKRIDSPKTVQPSKTEAPADPVTWPPEVGVDVKKYVIGNDDVLYIRVWREPDFTGPVVVRPDGNVTMPLIGDVVASGVTPYDLQQTLKKALGQYVNNPDVQVVVQAVRSKKFLISGEVGAPGSYPLVQPTTVLEAIVGAGGLREYANKKDIVIMRGSQRLKFNYKEVIDGKKLQQNILLEHGDHILVK